MPRARRSTSVSRRRTPATRSLEGAKAAVRQAELNMEWTHVVAPISGRISTHRVSVGNLIVGGQGGGATTLLTTIVSEDPIYLCLRHGRGRLRRLPALPARAEGRARSTATSTSPSPTRWSFKHKGSLDFLDNEMDRASGTLRARATVPNPDLFIAAGQFARLRLPTSGEKERLLVPEAALSTDQSSTMVMTVTPDNTIVPKIIQIGAAVGDLRIVKSGLGPTSASSSTA